MCDEACVQRAGYVLRVAECTCPAGHSSLSKLVIGGYCQRGGLSLSCLYPPLTQSFYIMGQIDKKWLDYMYDEESKKEGNIYHPDYGKATGDVSSSGEIIGSDDPQSTSDQKSLKQKIDEAIANLSTSNITSRDDIINPEHWLSQYYKNFIPTSAEGIAQYNNYLQLLRNIQAQQQASFDEWYNSPLQQSVRDKVAGLNPDILGLSGSSTSSPDVGTGTPTQGLPTSDELNIQREQLRLQRFNQLITAVGSVANLGSVFSSLSRLPLEKSLISSQVEAQNLANLSNFETMVGREVSSRLSDAVSSSLASGGLDIASWFSDDKNFEGIFEAYSPSDTPTFRTAYNNVRKRMQSSLGSAYEQGRITAENQGSFAAMAADPSYSADVLVQVAQLRPYMEARRELELARNEYETSLAEWNKKYQEALDVRSAVDVANAQNDYNAEYYDNMDAEKQALYDTLIKRSEGIAAKMKSAIDDNFLSIYNNNKDNMKGISAAYLFSGGASNSWLEYLYTSEIMYDMHLADPSTGLPNTGSKLHDWSINPTGVPSIRNSLFLPPAVPGSILNYMP